jgi:archaetidylinositol phosphate synthase
MSQNTWLHRSVRASVRPLARTGVTPNHLTTARLLTGVLAAGFFAVGSATAQYWAASFFLLSMFLDRADGELARVSGKSSLWGHQYDLFCDALCNALVFLGIGVGLRDGVFGWTAILMGVIAGAAVVLILRWMMRVQALHGERAADIGVTAAVDPDDAVIVIPVAALLDLMEPLLLAAAIGAPTFALLAYRYRWRSLLTQSAHKRY